MASPEDTGGDTGHDARERRCPRLGHPVTFAYCRLHAAEKGPCFKALDCWWEIFDVAAYFKERLSEEDFARLAEAKPKPKICSILELIQQARDRIEE